MSNDTSYSIRTGVRLALFEGIGKKKQKKINQNRTSSKSSSAVGGAVLRQFDASANYHLRQNERSLLTISFHSLQSNVMCMEITTTHHQSHDTVQRKVYVPVENLQHSETI